MAILGSARHRGRMTRKGYEFKHSALCARAIAGDVYPSRVRTHADRFRHVHEQIVYLQRQINNRMHDVTQTMHRLVVLLAGYAGRLLVAVFALVNIFVFYCNLAQTIASEKGCARVVTLSVFLFVSEPNQGPHGFWGGYNHLNATKIKYSPSHFVVIFLGGACSTII